MTSVERCVKGITREQNESEKRKAKDFFEVRIAVGTRSLFM
jgi:hypothetical protein